MSTSVRVEVTLEFDKDLGPGDGKIVAHDIAQKLFIGDPWFGLANILRGLVLVVDGEEVARKELIDA
jgi:hypothetical protein